MDRPPFSEAFLSRYEILRPLGEGANATVYLARQKELDRVLAIKAFRSETFSDAESKARFLSEGRILAKIRHTNILDVYDSGVDGDILYLALEYVSGGDLKDRIARQKGDRSSGGLSPEETFRIGAEICDALTLAHAQGIVHRDLKPENILLDTEGTAKVADFGFAKFDSENLHRSFQTQAGMILGTPHYLAPEIIQTLTVTPLTDIYALGIVLFECLTGTPPFLGNDPTAVLLKHTKEEIPAVSNLVPHLSPEIDHLIWWCCQKDPKKRPASAAELKEALKAGKKPRATATQMLPLASQGAARPPIGGASAAFGKVSIPSADYPSKAPSTRSSSRFLWGLALFLCVGLGGLFVYSLKAPSPPQELLTVRSFSGFSVQWRSESTRLGKVAYRPLPEGTWQEVPERPGSQGAKHELHLSDLSEGLYEVALVLDGVEYPCPPIQVETFKKHPFEFPPQKDGSGYTLKFRTNIPVRVAFQWAEAPQDKDFSPLSENHSIDLTLAPTETWSSPLVYLEDVAGTRKIIPVPYSLSGWIARVRGFSRKMKQSDLNYKRIGELLEDRIETLVSSAAEEISALEKKHTEISQEKQDEASPNLIGFRAKNEYLESLGNPLLKAFEGRDLLVQAAQLTPWFHKFFQSEEVSNLHKRSLYDSLQKLVSIDALAGAHGVTGPLQVQSTLKSLIPQTIVSPKDVSRRLDTLARITGLSRGVRLFHLETMQEHTLILPRYHSLDVLAQSVARTIGKKLYGVRMDTTDQIKSAPLILPPASQSKTKHLSLHGFNINPFLVVKVLFKPQNGAAPLAIPFHNTAQIFPGIDSVSHKKIFHDQIHEAKIPAWMLPPGEYLVEVSGAHVPGKTQVMAWSMQDLFVTW